MRTLIKAVLVAFKRGKCTVYGHVFRPARAYLLPARQCDVCWQRQVQLPSGTWVNSKD